MSDIVIKCIPGGSFLTNSYIVGDGETLDAILIDPGSQVREILAEIESSGFDVKRIINTHAHIDHAAGVEEAKQELEAEFYLHPEEEPVLDALPESAIRFPEFSGVKVPSIDKFVEEGDEIPIGNHTAKVLHTPGHTFGSICLLINEHVISGDTLFAGSVGRVDLTGGTSMRELVRSIKTKLMPLPDSYNVYPGHGPYTTIGIERRSNPFISGGLILL